MKNTYKTYNYPVEGTQILGAEALVRYLHTQVSAHPEYVTEARQFKNVLRNVKNFDRNAECGTYDAVTSRRLSDNEIDGVCVTFHQNKSTSEEYGYYSENVYALLCVIAMHELGTKSVNIGFYGNPEVSFTVKGERALEKAKAFGALHNQHSVYDATTGETHILGSYKKEYNPVNP